MKANAISPYGPIYEIASSEHRAGPRENLGAQLATERRTLSSRRISSDCRWTLSWRSWTISSIFRSKAAFVSDVVTDKQIADRNFKGVICGVLGKMGSKIGGAVAEEIAGDLVEAAAPTMERLGTLVGGLLQNGVQAAILVLRRNEKPDDDPQDPA